VLSFPEVVRPDPKSAMRSAGYFFA
jgi:hypothetical protein